MMSFRFASLEDTPDYIVGQGHWLIMTYSYKWGSILRTKTWRRHITQDIHLRDLVKLKQQPLVNAWGKISFEEQGDPPRLFNIDICVAEIAQL